MNEKMIDKAKDYAAMNRDWLAHQQADNRYYEIDILPNIRYRGKYYFDAWGELDGKDPFDVFGYERTKAYIWELLWHRDTIYEQNYDIDHKGIREDFEIIGKYRYALGITGVFPLLCIGINPSMAFPRVADATIRQVQAVVEQSDRYDGFVMLNLYPLRQTNPDLLPINANEDELSRNIETIRKYFIKYEGCDVWMAWGSSVTKRSYLRQCAREIIQIGNQNNVRWLCRGVSSKELHPHHPLRQEQGNLSVFDDINTYIDKLL